jgi:hypothetical protein
VEWSAEARSILIIEFDDQENTDFGVALAKIGFKIFENFKILCYEIERIINTGNPEGIYKLEFKMDAPEEGKEYMAKLGEMVKKYIHAYL